MRTLKRDMERYDEESREFAHEDDENLGDFDESKGWKTVQNEVFMAPPYLILFSSLIGLGSQIVVLLFLVIMACIAYTLYISRGAVLNTFFVGFAVTSFISGFMSGTYYKWAHANQTAPGKGMHSFLTTPPGMFQSPLGPLGGGNSRLGGGRGSSRGKGHGGMRGGGGSRSQWKIAMVCNIGLAPIIFGMVGMPLHILAMWYDTVHALDTYTILKMWSLFFMVSILSVIGTIVGRNVTVFEAPPCRVALAPGAPPPRSSILFHPIVIMLFSG